MTQLKFMERNRNGKEKKNGKRKISKGNEIKTSKGNEINLPKSLNKRSENQ